ncbi:transcription termination factor NusA [Spiroplasma diminutum]|uniref:Transcription termination/antitermination protein NusA n=1 Tax=Spiroplasma diminutum CUAS-1 TaxID=1276221 RepID=S5MJ89_9MOLU|nr:transcription termination factor NusA [Spiroplasma diminutum]AGR42030.1 transcription elongation factor NusA [Spiroplasma diminutum CUAS-1]
MIDGAQLLDAIYEIVQDKKIDKEIILEGIREGFQKAYEKFFDPEAIVRVDIDQNTGQIKVFKELTVVQKIEDEWLEIGLNTAKEQYGEEVSIGDNVYEPVEFTLDFSKLAVMQVGQIIKQKIREGEKNKIYQEFLSKNHEIVGGFVKDITETSYLVDVDGSIIPIWNKKMIPGENFDIDDRICFYIEEVSRDNKHSQIQASRIHPEFLTRLMETEVPEISEGIVEVKSVSREPGHRAKIAVFSHEEGVDPIGSCVGAAGSRIKNITKELNGEKIDVVLWNEDPKTFVMNSLAPVKVISIDINEENNECFIVVPNEQLSLAIGKRGMAARLVANLVNMKINIFSLENAKEKEIEIKWNGNIDENELNNPDFLNKVNKRREKTANNFNKENNFVKQEEKIEEIVFVEEDKSIDEIQASIAAFESLSEDESQFEFEESIDSDDDYDSYYQD